MRVPLPGPRNLLDVLERGASSLEQLLSVVPRAVTLADDAAALLSKAETLIDRIEQTRVAAEAAVRSTEAVVGRAEQLVEASAPLVARTAPLVDDLEAPLRQLTPTLQRLAETTDPSEVDAMVALIDHLPGLAARMDTDVIPVLDSLKSVAPDLHDLLDVSREVNEMLASLPGLGRIKKRIDEEQAEQGRG